MSKVPNEEHPANPSTPRYNPRPNRRCVTANAALSFTSPDRYIPQRPDLNQSSPSYRVSKPPSTLRGHGLYTRRDDNAEDPFGPVTSSRASLMLRRQRAHNTYQLRPPQHTPAFVHGSDAGPVALESRPGAESLRQLSWRGFWTVGGRSTSYFGQLYPVPTGRGGTLTSGTNAPMRTSPFMDSPNTNDRTKAHERRLALALDLDQAAKVLEHNPKKTLASSLALGSTAVMWQNGQ